MKKTLLIWALLLSCAALFFAAGYFWKAPKPTEPPAGQKPWNSRAIESTFAEVQVRQLDATHAAVDFVYDLDNRTNSDFQLTPGPGAVIMKRFKADGSLSSDADARLVSDAFVPTNNRTRITVEIAEPFNWPAQRDSAADQSFRDFVARASSGLEGFVIFDQITRYEIDLPIRLAASAVSLKNSD